MMEAHLNNIARRARLCKAAIVLAGTLTVAAFAAVLLANGHSDTGVLKVESPIHEVSKVAP